MLAPHQLLSDVITTGVRLTGSVVSTALGGDAPADTEGTLADQFTALLDTSAEVRHSRPQHPAYQRIVDELEPDEARILRLFANTGAQPSVDVRTKRPFGVGDRLIAPGLTMIGLDAGCADPERVPTYLHNLHRLGLVWFSDEAIAEVDGYQVLEAQPDVIAAVKSVRRAATRLRSIELTPLGRSFCETCGLTE